jgi:hypothetical protein
MRAVQARDIGMILGPLILRVLRFLRKGQCVSKWIVECAT